MVHDFLPEQIDNRIAGHVADELLPLLARSRSDSSGGPNTYAESEHQLFERYVGAIVRSIDSNERRAWHCFYDNTLNALRGAQRNGNRRTDGIDSFAAIYACVGALVAEAAAGTLLDVATCFGFLPLSLALSVKRESGGGADLKITGCDLNPALIGLAEDYARQRRIDAVHFIQADILGQDLARDEPSFDVVSAIHLLEHLSAEETDVAIANMWALAGRRLIIAVPFEAAPDRRFGHRQAFDRGRLESLAQTDRGAGSRWAGTGLRVAWRLDRRRSRHQSPAARGGHEMSYDVFRSGLSAPICLTWEITYACNLRCVHCLSSSGKRRSDELTTADAKRLIDEWAAMKVFYINVGGGEPMSRPDFLELMDYALNRGIGVKFSTNGTLIDDAAARWIASRDYLDLQISIDGVSAETNDPVRGEGSYARAQRAMRLLAAHDVSFKINATLTRTNYPEIDALYAMAQSFAAELRLTRLRPTGRGAEVWNGLRPTKAQNRGLYDWLRAHPDVLTGDSFFHLSAYGEPTQGLNMCGAGRIVCCVDPVGDVYACPFTLASEFRAGNVRSPGGFTTLWREAPLFAHLRRWEVGGGCQACGAYDDCHGGCIAVKHFTGRSLDAPDPDCVFEPDDEPLSAAGGGR
ncbi:MAG: mycofactocin radical SAM maturase [Rhodospirillales bacterium]|nr:mycofactocin radical SAM maturase [Rhodospirillales bacterium]